MKYLCCIYNTCLAIIIITFFISIWVYGSTIEAEVYNDVSGSSISTWDAMWSTYVISYGENCGRN